MGVTERRIGHLFAQYPCQQDESCLPLFWLHAVESGTRPHERVTFLLVLQP
jgi:hypothetical protein